jgi:uroporphyrinogen-III synthase
VALAARGLRADLVPPAYVAEAVAEALIAQGIAGRRLLLARAAEARPVLPERLRAAGATVEVLPLYRTVPPPDLAERARALLTAEKIDIVTFTSASTVRHLVAALGGTDLLRSLTVACIGPVTAQAAAELGLRVDIVAPEHTIPGLVEALIAHESTRTLPEGGVVQWRR